MADRATANLPSRDFAATLAFYGALGFSAGFRDDGWMILNRGDLMLEFFPHPGLDPLQSWFSACLRVDDLAGLHHSWAGAGLPAGGCGIPRITGIHKDPDVPRMFAVVDPDGSLLRVLENGG